MVTLLLFWMLGVASVTTAKGNKIEVNSTAELLYAFANELKSDTTVVIEEGEYSLTSLKFSFHGVNNVAILGAGRGLTLLKCEFGIGLDFFNNTNLTLANFSLLGCGKLMESTSINITNNNKPAVFRAALYFLDCTNVTIDNLEVSNSTGTGIAMYDVTGKVLITNSLLQYNKPKEVLPSSGGMSIEFTYCLKPGEVLGMLCNITYTLNAVYTIQNCSFNANIARSLNVTKSAYIVPHAANHQQFGRGGGISVFFRGRAINNTIYVHDCNFTSNQAVWGGGLHFDIFDESKGNEIEIENSRFESNRSPYQAASNSTGTGGGGIRIALFPQYGCDYQSHITLANCTFVNNSAYYGGGISVQLLKENILSVSSTIKLLNCVWKNNIARTGSAVDITVEKFPSGVVPVVHFHSCTFIGNANKYTSNFIQEIGQGTLYSKAVSVMFHTTVIFLQNYGSAIAGIGAQFEFNDSTVAVFKDNAGDSGGAIALLGEAFIVIHPKTTFKFSNNQARVSGGAIFSLSTSKRDFIDSGNCFLFYHNISVSPYDWDTEFIFEANYAPLGRSIYCTTLMPCVWGGLPGGTVASKEDMSQVFYWEGTFSYNGVNRSYALDREIDTDVSDITNYNRNNNEMLYIPPGRYYQFDFRGVDDRREIIHSAYIVQTNDTSDCIVGDTSSYSSHGIVQLKGQPGSVIDLTFQSVSTRPLSITFHVTVDQCPPGFHQSYGTPPNETTCVCSAYHKTHQYIGIVQCDDFKLVSYLKPQFWAGYTSFHGQVHFVTSPCPDGYCFTNGTSLLELPPDSSSTALEELLCKPQNRKGQFCGECESGYCAYPHMNKFKCGKYHWWHTALVVLRYLFVVVLLMFLIRFNVSLVDGLWTGCIYYSQVLFTIRIDTIDEVSPAIYHFVYGVWNLNFLEQVFPACTSPKFTSALPVLAFEYVLFSVAVVVTVAIIVCHVLKKEQSRGISNAIVTCFVLFFVKITTVSFLILSPAILSGPGGFTSTVHVKVRVVQLDGTKHYLRNGHEAYAVPAILLVILFSLPPLVFLVYRMNLCNLCKKQNGRNKNEHTGRYQLLCICLEKYRKHLFDPLCGPYRKHCCIFAGLYFVYRLLAVLIYCFVTSLSMQYILHLILHLTMLIIHLAFRPYRKHQHNVTNAIVFACLMIISTISLYRLHVASDHLDQSVSFYWIQFTIIMFPVLIMIYAMNNSYYMRKRDGYESIDDDDQRVPYSVWYILSLFLFLCISVVVSFIIVGCVTY